MSDFGPRITVKIVEGLRDDIMAGKLKSGSEIKVFESKLMRTHVYVYAYGCIWLLFLHFQNVNVNVNDH